MQDILTKKFRKLPALHFEVKLDAGCGNHKRSGFTGLDLFDYGQEIVWDLEDGVPLPDDSCVEVFTQHTLEHVQDMVGIMDEFWRVLKPGGTLTVIVPHRTADKAYIPTHTRRLDEGSFRFFEEDHPWNSERRRGPERWKILEMAVNDRPDLVVRMVPVK